MKKKKICRRYITRGGRRIYPPPGKKAFCFWVTEEQDREYQEKKRKQG